MNGILSPTPCPGSIRLLLGAQLLLLVQAGLIVRAMNDVRAGLWAVSLASLLMGLGCLAVSLRGERKPSISPWWKRRHD